MVDAGEEALAEIVAQQVHRWCYVTTRTGSVYEIVESARPEFFVRVENIPNAHSCAIDPERWWRIEAPDPWPPRVGLPLALFALSTLARDDAERIPGGGKITSPVRAVETAEWR